MEAPEDSFRALKSVEKNVTATVFSSLLSPAYTCHVESWGSKSNLGKTWAADKQILTCHRTGMAMWYSHH